MMIPNIIIMLTYYTNKGKYRVSSLLDNQKLKRGFNSPLVHLPHLEKYSGNTRCPKCGSMSTVIELKKEFFCKI